MNPEQRYLRANRIAHLLDSSFRIPGTSIHVGWDPIVGLLPGAGDLLMLIPSAWIIVEAYRIGVSGWSIVRMLLNVALETAIGAIPILGDLFDFWWKANDRNVRIIEKHLGIEQGRMR